MLRATPHFAGASRRAWSVDVETGSGVRPLFLLRDKGDRGGSARDAAFLRALADTPVPVPAVIGTSEADGAILLSRAPGRSEFPPPGDEAERERVAAHLMAVTAALHALDPSRLALDFLSDPTGATANADRSAPLAQARAAARALGPGADPFYTFALDWLEANRPPPPPRLALVHSDMGPGNFLYEDGRVTAIVDWEVAHVGDPMEDLAAIAVRDMATPVGSLAKRLREYAAAAGASVDLARVDYHRAVVLVRNSLMIGLGLAHPSEDFDVVEMTMYQTLLVRAAALVLCDNLGLARPTAADATPVPDTGSGLIDAIRRDFTRHFAPQARDEATRRRAEAIERALATLAHEAGTGPELDRREAEEIAALLDRRVDAVGRPGLETALHTALASRAGDPDWVPRAAAYFARRMHRLAERRRPLMGALYGRLPQPLAAEDAP